MMNATTNPTDPGIDAWRGQAAATIMARVWFWLFGGGVVGFVVRCIMLAATVTWLAVELYRPPTIDGQPAAIYANAILVVPYVAIGVVWLVRRSRKPLSRVFACDADSLLEIVEDFASQQGFGMPVSRPVWKGHQWRKRRIFHSQRGALQPTTTVDATAHQAGLTRLDVSTARRSRKARRLVADLFDYIEATLRASPALPDSLRTPSQLT